MALVPCTKCGNRVSTTAIKRPRCGTPPPNLLRQPAQVHTAKPPVQPPAKERQSASALGDIFKIQGLQVDQDTVRQISIAACLLIVAWWVFFSIPASPTYAIYTFYRNVKAHNAGAAASFIDFESVTKSVTDELMNVRAEDKPDGPTDESTEVLHRRFADLMSGAFSETLKARFERSVEDSSQKDSATMTFGDLIAAVWYLHRTRNTATTQTKDPDGDPFVVTFVRQPDSGWRVTAIGGPAFRKVIREQMKKQSEGTSPALPPSSDSRSSPGL
ncbi:MAG: hypothetical protein ACLQDV_09535 [Candidatus Binataceae bacterium]